MHKGIRLENQQFGEEHGLGLNGNGIESVEIIKGPASLLYGSDAMGGVLYFNPEKYANGKTTIELNQVFHSNTQDLILLLGLNLLQISLNFFYKIIIPLMVIIKLPNGKQWLIQGLLKKILS